MATYLTASKQLLNNYACIATLEPTDIQVGDTIVVASIAAPFNGTFTVLSCPQYEYTGIDSTTGPNIITVISSANLQVNRPIIFTTDDPTGNLAGVEIGFPYYIKSISGTDITISTTRNNGVAGPEYQGITSVTSGNVDVDYTTYVGSDIFRRIPLQPF